MSPLIALAFCILFIIGLFVVDYRRGASPRIATWVPLFWVLILLSRPLSLWINPAALHGDVPYDLTEGNPIDRLYFSSLIVAGLIVLIIRRARWSALIGNNLLIMVFVFYCALSITWADYPFVALKRWIKMLGDYIMIFILLTEEDPDEAVKSVIKSAAFILVPLSILFIKYMPVYGRMYHRWSGEVFYGGVTTHKNTLGLVCVIAGVLLFSYLCDVLRKNEDTLRRVREGSVYVLLLVMIVWLLILARSSTAMVTFAVGIGVYAGLGFSWVRRRPDYLGLFCLSSLVLATVVLLLADFIPFVVSLLGRDMTLTGRTQFWEDLINTRNNAIIGTGFDSFWLGDRAAWFWSEYYWRPNQAHNGLLEVYLNLGLIGLMFLVAILVSFYKKSREELFTNYDRGRIRVTLLVVALLYNMTEASFKALNPLWFLLLLFNMEYGRPGSVSATASSGPDGGVERRPS